MHVASYIPMISNSIGLEDNIYPSFPDTWNNWNEAMLCVIGSIVMCTIIALILCLLMSDTPINYCIHMEDVIAI